MADRPEMEEYPRPSVTSEKNGKGSSDEEQYKYDQDPYRNESFKSHKAAQEYERKKANALLANPLRGYSEAELRKLGKNYALGKKS